MDPSLHAWACYTFGMKRTKTRKSVVASDKPKPAQRPTGSHKGKGELLPPETSHIPWSWKSPKAA